MSLKISEIKLSPSGTKRGQLKFDRIFWSFPISDDTLHVHNCTPALPILEAKMSFANIRKVARHLASCVIRLASEYAPVVGWKQAKWNQAKGRSTEQQKMARRQQRKLSLLSLCSISSGGRGEHFWLKLLWCFHQFYQQS